MTGILYDTPGPGPAGYKPKPMDAPPSYSMTPRREQKDERTYFPSPADYSIKIPRSEIKKSISSKPV